MRYKNRSLLAAIFSLLPRYPYLSEMRKGGWGVIGNISEGSASTQKRREPLFTFYRINRGKWRTGSMPIVLALGTVTAEVEVWALGVRGVDYGVSSATSRSSPYSAHFLFRNNSALPRPSGVRLKEKALPRYRSENLTLKTPRGRVSIKATAVKLAPIDLQANESQEQ